jgi:uncharacterized protein (TIGR00269 family)
MDKLICSACKTREAFYFRKYSGEALCKKCFTQSIEAKVRTTITCNHMLSFDDHLAVGVSGGKDSLSLLHILAKLKRFRPKTSLTAVTVDEGIRGYRDEALEIAAANCRELEIPHHIVSFRGLYGSTLDEIMREARSKGDMELTACAYCGVLRRKALNIGAREVNANKVATAHTLDDEVQTILMNVFRGDITRLAKERPVTSEVHPLLVKKIKPLCEIPEEESALYAYIKKIVFQETLCPYASEAMRNDVRGIINYMEARRAGTKFSVFKAIERLRPVLEEAAKKEEFRTCVICGEPSASDLCKTCEILKIIR